MILLLVKPLGGYMTRVFAGERTFLSPVLGPVERGFYRLSGVDERDEQHWLDLRGSPCCCSTWRASSLLYALHAPAGACCRSTRPACRRCEPDLAFNTAVSFTTNTNWQCYGGEATMSYLSQMAGLTVHNFVSAATGIALAVALVRGFARASASDASATSGSISRAARSTCCCRSRSSSALFLVWQGMPQNLGAYIEATTLEGAKQTIAQGPVASQNAIKMLGTNGGGFFNANSAHPFENPTAAHQLRADGLDLRDRRGAHQRVRPHGRRPAPGLGDPRRDGRAVPGRRRRRLLGRGARQSAAFARARRSTGGNMEGKEVRFGIANSALFAIVTTAASCGAVNAMHDSFMPLGGLIPLFNIQLGEVIFGGVGAGLYGMLLFAIIAVFIAGLMVGRTPEYLGKKIEAKEVKMAMLAILILPLSILGFTAIAVGAAAASPASPNAGPHGFTEILYAFTSAPATTAPPSPASPPTRSFYNTDRAARDADRPLPDDRADAGDRGLAGGQEDRAGLGRHLPDHTAPLFVGLLVGVILIVGGLTFFPALALGPIVEHLAMLAGTLLSGFMES